MELMDLPPELLIGLLVQLDFRNLLRCRQVCSTFKRLIDDDVRVQYKVELAVAGMEDGPPSNLTPSDRLAILRTRETAWNTLSWTSRQEIPMLKGAVWELYGGVLAQAEGDRTLMFKQLPSAIRGIEEKNWSIPDVGATIRDFGMDPAQDLLVIVEHHRERSEVQCCVHLRSLATGALHPDAPKSGMVSYNLKSTRCSYTIQTSEDHLGLLTTYSDEDSSELLIWNWKTGVLLMHVNAPELPAFAFLTTHYILIAVLPFLELDEGNVLHGTDDPHLIILDLTSVPAHPTALADIGYLCAFYYPKFADTSNVVAMAIRSDPAPHWRPHPSLKVPFSVAREDRLFVITLWVMERHLHWGLLSLVPASTLLAAIASLAPGETRRQFDWNEWGPAGSRLLVAPPTHTSVWVCYVYGMTFAMALRQGSQKAIFTLDFNQLAIRRTGSRADDGPEGGAALMMDSDVFKPSRLFKEPVQTALPYWLRKMCPFGAEGAEGEGHFEAVMLGEDSLIMVSSQPHIRKYRILTF